MVQPTGYSFGSSTPVLNFTGPTQGEGGNSSPNPLTASVDELIAAAKAEPSLAGPIGDVLLQDGQISKLSEFQRELELQNRAPVKLSPTIQQETSVEGAVRRVVEAADVKDSERAELKSDVLASVDKGELRIKVFGDDGLAVSGGVRRKGLFSGWIPFTNDQVGNPKAEEGRFETLPSATTSCCESGPNWDVPFGPGATWANPAGTRDLEVGVLVVSDNITNGNVVDPGAAMDDFGSTYASYAQQFANHSNAPFVVVARDTTPVEGVPDVQVFSVMPQR